MWKKKKVPHNAYLWRTMGTWQEEWLPPKELVRHANEHVTCLFTNPSPLTPPPLFSTAIILNPFPQQCCIREEDFVLLASSKCIEDAMSEHSNKKEKSQTLTMFYCYCHCHHPQKNDKKTSDTPTHNCQKWSFWRIIVN